MAFCLVVVSGPLLSVSVSELLIAVASLVAGVGSWAVGLSWPIGSASCTSPAPEHRLDSCGARASLLCGMWGLPVQDRTHDSCIARWILDL